MFPPTNGGASGQTGAGMFLDPLEAAGGAPASGAAGSQGGQQGGQPGAPTVDPNEPTLQAGQTEKDLYEKRKAYWQSKVDKATAHARKLQETLDAQRDAIAVGQLAMKNPAMLQGLVTLPGQPGALAPPQEDKPPVAPERPDSYNEAEAYTNPESESWKFRKKVEAYQNEKLAFLERRDMAREKALREMDARRKAEAEAQERDAQFAHYAMTTLGVKQHEIPALLDFVRNGTPSPEDIVLVFRHKQRREAGNQNPGQMNVNQHQPPPPEYQGRGQMPPPVVRQGAGQTAGTVENAVSLDLIRAAGGR